MAELLGFNPEEHDMVGEDAWVSKQAEPQYIAEYFGPQDNELVDRLTKLNNITASQAAEMVHKANEKHGIYETHEAQASQRLRDVFNRKRLYVKRDLGVLTNEESVELSALDAELANPISRLVAEFGMSNDEAIARIDSVLQGADEVTAAEAAEILIGGPLAEGFAENKHCPTSDEEVRASLVSAFGLPLLRRARITRVINDRHILFTPLGSRPNGPELRAITTEIGQQGLGESYNFSMAFVTDNPEKYLVAAQLIEGKDNKAELTHRFKFRAEQGDPNRYSSIRTFSMDFDEPGGMDYLQGRDLSDEEVYRLYLLGTIAHEIAHRLTATETQLLADYGELHRSMGSEGRATYVTDYSEKYKTTYQNTTDKDIDEDFCEAVRLYVTNPNFLQAKYPQKFKFIQSRLPEINSQALQGIGEATE